MCYNNAMVTERVRETIKKHNLIEKGEHIVIGLSGGPDSVCLFSVLTELADEMELTVHPVHVNHKFRPGAAERDQKYAENLCKSRGIECRSFEVDCIKLARELGMTSEEAGRRARYDAFFSVAKEVSQVTGCHVKIAVAQNANDQAETLLFRLIRGTGTDGLAGIAYERNEREFKVIRPLLDVYRDEIEKYCEVKGLKPVIDHTNSQPIYSRNKIRLELIPLLEKKYNENMKETLVRLSKIAKADKEYLWLQADRAYKQVLTDSGENYAVLDKSKVAKLHEAVRHRLIMRTFDEIGLSRDITEERLAAVDELLSSQGEMGLKTLEFPHGYRLKIVYDSIFLTSSKRDGLKEKSCHEKDSPKISVDIIDDACRVEKLRRIIREKGIGKDTAIFDRDKMEGCCFAGEKHDVELRMRREGDFIRLSGGEKKLRKLMIDMKIPSDMRDCIYVAASGSEILWLMCRASLGENSTLCGRPVKDRFAETYKIDNGTRRILMVKIV